MYLKDEIILHKFGFSAHCEKGKKLERTIVVERVHSIPEIAPKLFSKPKSFQVHLAGVYPIIINLK